GWQLGASDTPIQPLLVGESSAALQLAARLRDRGVWVSAIRPPTVPAGTARLR
ncbi:aminotransferase class I/II-fold pyridoxal phosphate-dependent enzyme, partial [Aeromonas salmonicida]